MSAGDHLREQAMTLDRTEIDAQHDAIAALLHARNAAPDDTDLGTKLQAALEHLRKLQHEFCARLPSRVLPQREDSATIKRARAILAEHERKEADRRYAAGLPLTAKQMDLLMYDDAGNERALPVVDAGTEGGER